MLLRFCEVPENRYNGTRILLKGVNDNLLSASTFFVRFCKILCRKCQ